jgi:two-component system nitrate/nitrite response regulator NarL
LPELDHALRWEEAPQFRATMQCQGRRGNGEAFTADVWFSTYKEGAAPKIAAIIAEVAAEAEEEPALDRAANSAATSERASLNNREISVMRLLVQGMANKEIAGSMDVSESTVKNTLQQLFAKTKVRTRAQLVRVAIEQYRDTL